MTEREAYVAFNLADNIGSVGVDALSERFGGVAAAWERYEHKLSRQGGEIDVAGQFEKAKRYGVTILTPVDDDYPDILRKTRGHPLVLYVKGSVKALSKPSVAIVGTRRATSYGLDQANSLGRDLAESGWCVLSGLALGIDAEAHKGALAVSGVTVGVLGSALDRFYPDENRELARDMIKKGGAVVSEFPFGRGPDQQTFPQRNHVIAALASGVVAVEAPVKSGTLITAGIAAELGRTVMAVPGRVDSPRSAGCLKLIRSGAVMVRGADDVNETLGELLPSVAFNKAEKRPRNAADRQRPVEMADGALALEESMIMRELDEDGVSMDRLVDLTGLPPSKVRSLCMTLRLKERVRFLPGDRVALKWSRT